MSIIGFSDDAVKWFQSYQPNQKFSVNYEIFFPKFSSIVCGVPQVPILGSLLFLIYVNDKAMIMKCKLFLYVDGTCLAFGSDNSNDIENQLHQDFANICDWFVDNKLIIHFGDDKTKSISFASKHKSKAFPKYYFSVDPLKCDCISI